MGVGYFERDAAPTAPAFERDESLELPRDLAADLGEMAPKFARVTLSALPAFVRDWPDGALLDAPLDMLLG